MRHKLLWFHYSSCGFQQVQITSKEEFLNKILHSNTLLWAYTSRSNNNKINSVHERALRLVEGNSDLDFEKLLVKYRSKSNHTPNISQLMLLLYKCLNNMGPSYLQEIFHLNSNSCNLRNRNDFKAEHVRTVSHGT